MNLPTRQQLIEQRMDELAGDTPETKINHLALDSVRSSNRAVEAIDKTILGNAYMVAIARLHGKALDTH